jgi:hypothetical protein
MPLRSVRGLAEVWLATPDAATQFDPSNLVDADRDEWEAIRTGRRQLDWASSRALLRAVPTSGDQKWSLSHSHGYAALALERGAVAVGVDVEWLSPRNFQGMADVAFTNAETAYLVSLNEAADIRSTFYEFWTLKEAFAKALGMPLLDALRQCHFIDSSGERRAVVPTTRPWRATVFAPRPQLRLAVVRMPGDPDPAGNTVRTREWPNEKADEWPVVLDLASHVSRAGDAC